MTSFRSIAAITVALGCRLLGGAAQYDSCINGTIADIGNGRCDAALNIPSCGFDGGDCCPCTCSDGNGYSCSDNDFDCLYPGCDEPKEEDAFCGGSGDGWCNSEKNTIECSWDGGDVSSISLELWYKVTGSWGVNGGVYTVLLPGYQPVVRCMVCR